MTTSIIIAVLSVWAILATLYALYLRSPLNDHGHRLYGVNSQDAQKVLGEIAMEVVGLKRQVTFDIGDSKQVVYDNGSFVLHKMDDERLSSTAASFVVNDPTSSATLAIDMLQNAGFSAELFIPFPSMLGKIVVVKTNATDGWDLVFRKHLVLLGEKPEDTGMHY